METKLEQGIVHVSRITRTWSNCLQRSYLKMRCKSRESGKIEKLYSTEDHFHGLRVTHQLQDKQIKLTVVQTNVQPRLLEIRSVLKDECKNLAPIVTKTSETYRFSVNNNIGE